MAIQYTNRKNQTYYLHQGQTKTGKPKYFFSMKSEGDLADRIPDGFEIYENPNAQVFLRKKRIKLVTDDEIALVEEGIKKYSDVKYYQVDTRKDVISIFLPNQNVEGLADIWGSFNAARAKEIMVLHLTYSPMLQFVLKDKEKRIFITRRYCFLGSVDDFIEIGDPGALKNLVKEYVKHLDKESYFELF